MDEAPHFPSDTPYPCLLPKGHVPVSWIKSRKCFAQNIMALASLTLASDLGLVPWTWLEFELYQMLKFQASPN